MPARVPVSLKTKREPGGMILVLLYRFPVFERFPVLEQFGLHLLDCFGERLAKFFEILFIEEDFVFLIFFLANALAFRDCNVEVLLGFRRFDVEEIGSLSGPDPLREDLIFVAVVIQCPALPD